MIDAPPQPVETLRQTPILYNADTGQRVGGRLQRWANAFTLPTGASVKVRPTTEGPGGTYARGATAEDDVLLWNRGYYKPHDRELARDGRFALWHELGHRYDRRFADQSVRDGFTRIMGLGSDWESGPNPPKEQFAEAIATYVLGHRSGQQGYGYSPTRRQMRKLRRLFDSQL